jgi:hypothetical protein
VKLLHTQFLRYNSLLNRNVKRDAIKNFENETNIRGGGKTVYVVFKYLSRSLLWKGVWGEG